LLIETSPEYFKPFPKHIRHIFLSGEKANHSPGQRLCENYQLE
jgi:hypothetical protein